ncbi:MAG: phosphodiesterase [Propionibacterium sp.]|nr:phosphodiesterase [Propionibacterium sp.]
MLTQISDCGFFPQLVTDSVALAVGEETVDAFLVHHEATFAPEGIGRHLSVLVLTATRLIVSHTDEHGDDPAGNTAISSTESVPLRLLGAVALTRVVSKPESFGSAAAEIVETWLTLSWSTMRRIDLEPANCGDPTCTADHGFQGSAVAEDMVIRMSPVSDGADSVRLLVEFGTSLQQRVH